MNKRAVVFDLDGTLIDSRGDIADACNHMLEAAGHARLSDAEIAGFVGDGARYLVGRALDVGLSGGPVSADALDRHLEVFLDYYAAHPVVRTTVLPGVEASLAVLRSAAVAVCTNKPRRTTDAVLRALGWERRFGAIVAGGDTREKKPHPEPIERCAELLGVRPEEIIMVGDGPQDVEAGRAAGALTIGVRGGILPEARLLASNPDVLLDSLEAFPAWLRDSGFAL